MTGNLDSTVLVPTAAPETTIDVKPTQEQDLQRLNADRVLANAMTRSLLFSLSRQHLDLPLDEERILALLPPERSGMEDFAFVVLEQVGALATDPLDQPYVALQTALASCRDPGRYRLLFLVTSDGVETCVYLGAWSWHRDHYPPEELANILRNSLAGNWPDTRFRAVDPKDTRFQIHMKAVKNLRYGVTLTGVPSLKPGDCSGYPQSLDRFLHSMKGLPFAYVVIADPMTDQTVNDVINRCLDLLGQVHTLTKSTMSDTLSKSIAQTVGREEATSESHAHSVSETRSEDAPADSTARWLEAAGDAMPELALIFPPAGILGAFMTKFGAGLKAPEGETRHSRTETDTYTTTSETSIVRSTGLTRNVAQAQGREYLDAHAEAAETLLRQYSARFEQARSLGCWNVGVYLLGETPEVVRQGAIQMRALLSGERSAFEPIRVHTIENVWRQGVRDALRRFELPPVVIADPAGASAANQRPFRHPLGPAFGGLTTPLSTEELALLINLPRRGIPGVPVVRMPEFALNVMPHTEDSLMLGNLLRGGELLNLPYSTSLPLLSKHTLIAGAPDSGSTATCQHLLGELNRLGVPFLVIESSRYDYLEWAIRLNESLAEDDSRRVDIHMPGVESWRGRKVSGLLHLNPFDVIWLDPAVPPQVRLHSFRVASLLAAYCLKAELPQGLLEKIVFSTYGSPYDWQGDTLPPFGSPFPTLDRFLDQISPTVGSLGYGRRQAVSISAELTTAAQSLQQGWMGKTFNQGRSTPWKTLFDRPVVVNLARFGIDSDRAFAMALLLQFLAEYRQAHYDMNARMTNGIAPLLHHVTVIEETHRIMGQTGSRIDGQSRVQAQVAAMQTGLLPDMTAHGEGMVFVCQNPTTLVPALISNTNLKIVHRLTDEADRGLMAGCMDLTAEQARFVSRLRPNQAIVYGEANESAAWVQIACAYPE